MRGTVAIAALKDLLDAFNAHDLGAIMAFFADDCDLCMPRAPCGPVHCPWPLGAPNYA